MDCYSPGQGLMPASFKVRTVPLDGDDSATEDVLDPDFGEAAIGRVAPVDSGEYLSNFHVSIFNNLDFGYHCTIYVLSVRIVVDYTITSIRKMLWRSFSAGES